METVDGGSSLTGTRWQRHALAFACWTLLALSYALSGGLSSISEGYPPAWSRALVWNLANFWLWMLLVPLVGWLGRRGAASSPCTYRRVCSSRWRNCWCTW